MPKNLIIVDSRRDWQHNDSDIPIITAIDYLRRKHQPEDRRTRVINLCRNTEYGGTGYYCSLLGEARGHHVLPDVRTLLDLRRQSLYRQGLTDLQPLLEKAAESLQKVAGATHVLRIFFGWTVEKSMLELARELFERLPMPSLEVQLRANGVWRIHRVSAVPVGDLNAVEKAHFHTALQHYLARRRRKAKPSERMRYDLAILHDPLEALPPSSSRTLKHFVRIGKRLGIHVELIQRRDYGRLAEFDALFIRETTRIDHHTYEFARKAEQEGLVVIDDPDSILRCTNKVYLTEILRAHQVPILETVIIRKTDLRRLEKRLSYPFVLKVPDGSFSRGVRKVTDPETLRKVAAELFADSDLLLAQPYCYTPFDWRIGMLDRQPLFACQYFMSSNHWQIVRHLDNGRALQGGFRTIPLHEAPAPVLQTAVRAANLIGDGLYGVDLKETTEGVFVVEVNDNPNIDRGIEDGVMGDALYETVLRSLIRRIETSHGRPGTG
ncbi:RimK family protein [Acidithiobacillus ferriphilus]|uniref:RimK family protein n=1 Tax=Acidithiobacillus TaxID=119977 RepID=UPI002147BB4E|nr:RimK family protein [Acidithiobacillus ferrooxidans]MCR1346554.1 RimK family protein [Acidithiobacillus ferrooxidans]MCR1356607.1 RimK family protein [Acidithiobacillus ferrooxidans]